MAAGLQEERGTNRFRSDIDLPQRGRGQHEPAVILPSQFGYSYRLFQHRAMIGADPLRGVRRLLPKLEHPGQHRKLLRVGQRTARLAGRLPGADQRPGHVVSRIPVVRLLNWRPAGRDQSWIGANDLGEPAVHLAPLAGQQLIMHRLPDQGVPEQIAIGVSQQHIGRYRRP